MEMLLCFCPHCERATSSLRSKCQACGAAVDLVSLSKTDLTAAKSAMEVKLGRATKQSRGALKTLLRYANVGEPDQISDRLLKAVQDSGWYDGRTYDVNSVIRLLAEGRTAKEATPLSEDQVRVLEDVVILGGTGVGLFAGSKVQLVFDATSLAVRENAEIRWVVPYGDIERIDLSGSTTRTGGGYVGGGFSLTGAAKGMMAAAALNALTESIETRTVLRVATASSEVFFLYRQADPGPLRIVLSHAFFAIESGRSEPQPST